MKNFLYNPSNPQKHKELGNYLKSLPEGEYVVKVKKNRPIRSLSANAYYHFCLKIIAIDTGHDAEDLHETMKLKFNSAMINFPKGGSQIIGKSTKDLDTKEFGAYINRVKNWAIQEYNIVIPEPKDLDYMKQMELENQYEKVFSGY